MSQLLTASPKMPHIQSCLTNSFLVPCLNYLFILQKHTWEYINTGNSLKLFIHLHCPTTQLMFRFHFHQWQVNYPQLEVEGQGLYWGETDSPSCLTTPSPWPLGLALLINTFLYWTLNGLKWKQANIGRGLRQIYGTATNATTTKRTCRPDERAHTATSEMVLMDDYV